MFGGGICYTNVRQEVQHRTWVSYHTEYYNARIFSQYTVVVLLLLLRSMYY